MKKLELWKINLQGYTESEPGFKSVFSASWFSDLPIFALYTGISVRQYEELSRPLSSRKWLLLSFSPVSVCRRPSCLWSWLSGCQLFPRPPHLVTGLSPLWGPAQGPFCSLICLLFSCNWAWMSSSGLHGLQTSELSCWVVDTLRWDGINLVGD